MGYIIMVAKHASGRACVVCIICVHIDLGMGDERAEAPMEKPQGLHGAVLNAETSSVTPDATVKFINQFQAQPLHESSEYEVLEHQRRHLTRQSAQRAYLGKQMLLLYQQIDKTRNYQEFTDVLENNASLLREIFTLESLVRRPRAAQPELDWSQRFGLSLHDYIAQNDELLTLQNGGYLN